MIDVTNSVPLRLPPPSILTLASWCLEAMNFVSKIVTHTPIMHWNDINNDPDIRGAVIDQVRHAVSENGGSSSSLPSPPPSAALFQRVGGRVVQMKWKRVQV
jgi:hypothetical protein